MARRRGANGLGDQLLALVVIIAVMLWLISIIIKVVVVVAAFALLTAVGWYIFKTLKRTTQRGTSEHAEAAVPAAPYSPLAPPDEAVFATETDTRLAGLEVTVQPPI